MNKRRKKQERWKFVDIKDNRIRKLVIEVLSKLGRKGGYYENLVDFCIKSIQLKKIKPYEKELRAEIRGNR